MKIGIIGTGLMGMSLAMHIKKKFPEYNFFGYDVNPADAEKMQVFKFITDTKDNIPQCDIFFICAPLKFAKELSVFYSNKFPNSIVSDISSVKTDICKSLKKYNNFVGAHPMTGSERKGALSAQAEIFDNSLYLLCPYENQKKSALRLERFLVKINQNIYYVNPELHDRAVAYASHLPYFTAVTLVNSLDNDIYNIIKNITGSGFRDTTRVASSPVDMWEEIANQNHNNILESLLFFKKSLNKTIEEIESKKDLSVSIKAKNTRDEIMNNRLKSGGNYCISVNVPDRPGILAHIFKLLENINIKNIEIDDSRNQISGALKIFVRTEEDMVKAKEILK